MGIENNSSAKEVEVKSESVGMGMKSYEKGLAAAIVANLGRHCSEETKAKMSAAHLGKCHTEEAKDKIRMANLGKKATEETRAKFSTIHKGKPSPRKGCKVSEETKAKLRASNLGKHPSAETLAKFSAVQMGHSVSEETRAKISAANKGHRLSEEQIARMSAAKRGKHLSEEHKAKVRLKLIGRPVSEETRAKISAAEKGKRLSDETKARVSAAQQGKQLSKEHKDKLRITSKLAYIEGRLKPPHNKKLAFTKTGIRVRSGWEATICDMLTDFGIEWLYEPDVFDMGKLGLYVPDLYLPKSDQWIEVKGWWRANAKAKYEKFAKTHKALLIGKRQYNVIAKHPYLLKDWLEGTVKPLENHTWQYKLV